MLLVSVFLCKVVDFCSPHVVFSTRENLVNAEPSSWSLCREQESSVLRVYTGQCLHPAAGRRNSNLLIRSQTQWENTHVYQFHHPRIPDRLAWHLLSRNSFVFCWMFAQRELSLNIRVCIWKCMSSKSDSDSVPLTGWLSSLTSTTDTPADTQDICQVGMHCNLWKQSQMKVLFSQKHLQPALCVRCVWVCVFCLWK